LMAIWNNMEQYENFKEPMEPYAFDNMPLKLTFMHDNDLKHSFK